MKINIYKRLFLITAFALLLNTVSYASVANDISSYEKNVNSYNLYLENYKNALRIDQTIKIDILKYKSSDNYVKIKNSIGGKEGEFLETNEEGYIEWDLNIEISGFYNINLVYYTKLGKGSKIKRAIEIDGKVPFAEAQNVTFSRVFKNSDEISKDQLGNDIRPFQQEVESWINSDIYDATGYYETPLKFYFENGAHKLRLTSIQENMVIGAIKLYKFKDPLPYTDVHKNYPNKNEIETTPETMQGENAKYKSEKILYPINDNSTSATEPSSPSHLLLNTIGGAKWSSSGQWLEWEVDIKSTGLYKIAIKARQNVNIGKKSHRKIYIDGKVPFKELVSVPFEYSNKWYTKTLGNKNEVFEFYLEQGEHFIKMEAVCTEEASIIMEIEEKINILRNIYLNIIMITGTNIDKNRDYDFENIFQLEIEQMKSLSNDFFELEKQYYETNGIQSLETTQLKNMAKVLKIISDDANRIADKINDFSNGISSLGSWITKVSSQPLEIDYIEFLPVNTAPKKATSTLLSDLIFMASQFYSSFSTDYKDIGSNTTDNNPLTVWITSGRDQAGVLNQLVKNDFTKNFGYSAKVQLIPAGTLLSATLAGKAPDVALSCPQTDPINYAIRGAVLNIKEFEDFNEVTTRFSESAMVPLRFNDSAYGLPETQSFPVMFYRKDILKTLQIDLPKTWEDVIEIIPILQSKNLNFGLQLPYSAQGAGIGIAPFAMFLFQNDGAFYDNKGKRTLINDENSIKAFVQWLDFYNLYTLPKQYDFATRFRSGEMPIGIADYSFYNMLSVFAPELEGIWDFSIVPGIKNKDGTINNTVASSITASMIMSATKKKNEAWSFLKWWTSGEVQQSYGNEIESILGTAGRYQSANKEAISKIAWKRSALNTLLIQLGKTQGIPEIPGSYMTPRYLDFAFKQANFEIASMNESREIKDILEKTAKLINEEISDKRKEFRLN